MFGNILSDQTVDGVARIGAASIDMSTLNHEERSASAFEKNLLSNQAGLRRFISAKVRDHQAVDDLLQETLLRTLRSADRGKVNNLFAYTVQVAKSVIVDYWRREDREPPLPETERDIADEQHCPAERQTQSERLDDLRAIIEAMPALRREVFVRRRLEGQSREEIAAAMALSVEAVKKHITRAMADVGAGMAARGWQD